MDILKLNKNHKGNIYLLVITDMFSKFTRAVPLPDMTTETVSKAFVDYWLSIFGAPDKLLTDQGSQFTSELFLSLCRIIGIKKVFTTPYHPQTDGVVERNNRTLVKMLAMYVSTDQQNWDQLMSMLTYTHNTARHSTTEETPYMMMFGREAPDFSPEVHELQEIAMTKADYADRFRDALIEAHRCARKAMKKAQRRYKRYYDRSVVSESYGKGDIVYLWQPSVPRKGSRKFTPPWRGPYRVKEKINELNVILGISTAEEKVQ